MESNVRRSSKQFKWPLSSISFDVWLFVIWPSMRLPYDIIMIWFKLKVYRMNRDCIWRKCIQCLRHICMWAVYVYCAYSFCASCEILKHANRKKEKKCFILASFYGPRKYAIKFVEIGSIVLYSFVYLFIWLFLFRCLLFYLLRQFSVWLVYSMGPSLICVGNNKKKWKKNPGLLAHHHILYFALVHFGSF